MRWESVLGAAIAAAVAAWPNAAGAAFVPPKEDTFVMSTAPAGSFGSAERVLTWTAYMSGGRGRSYLKFSTEGLPARGLVESVTLHLYQYDAGGFVPWVNIYYVGDDTWSGDTMTWNNRPLPLPAVADRIVRKDAGFAAGWVSFELPVDGAWDYDGDIADGFVSLLVRSDESGDERHNFYSSETSEGDAFKPRLEIIVVPEPGGAWVIGAGVMLLLRRRWLCFAQEH